MQKSYFFLLLVCCYSPLLATKISFKNERPFIYRFVVKSGNNLQSVVVEPFQTQDLASGCVDEIKIEYGSNFKQSKRLYTGAQIDQAAGKNRRCGNFSITIPFPNNARWNDKEEPGLWEIK